LLAKEDSMKSSSAFLNQITDIDLQQLKVLKDVRARLKKQLSKIESEVKGQEQNIISMYESGAELNTSIEFKVKERERRYPSWKEHFISECGKELADQVVSETEPKKYKEIVFG
jgi:hypothetical protein